MSKGTSTERKLVADATQAIANWMKGGVLEQMSLLLRSGRLERLDQIVVDASNFWRKLFGESVKDALLKFGKLIAERADRGLPLLNEEELEAFLSVAKDSMWHRTKHLVVFLKLVKASHLLIALDARKEMLDVLGKGRVKDTFADLEVTKHETAKLLNLLCKAKDRMRGFAVVGEKHPGAQEKVVRNWVADALHRSESGRQLLRLLVMDLKVRFGNALPNMVIDLCEAREADIAVLNSRETFRNGRTVEREKGWSVGVFANDLDVVTEIHARAGSEVFLNIVKLSPTKFSVRDPRACNHLVLKQKACRFAGELAEDALVISKDQAYLTCEQTLNLLLTHTLGNVDYVVNATETKLLVDAEGKTIPSEVFLLALRAYRGLLKQEAERNSGVFDASFARLVRFLRDPRMGIDKLDSSMNEMGETARMRLANALELRRNLLHLLHGMTSRVIINFPLLPNRRIVIEAVKKLFTPAFLQSEDAQKIVVAGETLELPMLPLGKVPNACVTGFLSVLIPCRNVAAKEPVTKRPKVAPDMAPKGLVFRKAEMGGVLGGSFEKEKVVVKKVRQRTNVLLPVIAAHQLTYDGLDSVLLWLKEPVGPRPELQTSLSEPLVEDMKRVLIVGVADSCLNTTSLLASQCAFSDTARLFVAELLARDGAVGVFSDAMLVANKCTRDCTICMAGLQEKIEVTAFVMQHARRLIAEYKPDVVVAFGQEASILYMGLAENVFSVTLPERAATAPNVKAAQEELFWGSFNSSFQRTAAALGMAGGDDELRLYRQYCTLPTHFKIERLEIEIQVAEQQNLTGTKGTAGLTTTEKAKKNKKQKRPVALDKIGSAGYVRVAATRTGVPWTAVEHSDYVRAMTEGKGADAPRELAGLVCNRLRKCVHTYNQMRLVVMLTDQVRAVAAAGEKGVAEFDNTAYKEIFILFSQKDVKAATESFCRLVRLPGAAPVFVVLRDFFLQEVMPFVSGAKLESCMATFFVAPLAQDCVTRLDVVARQQTLLLLDTLLLVLSKGAVRSASCAIWFAFSDEGDRKKMKNSLSTAEKDVELDVWETVADDGVVDEDWGGTKTAFTGPSLDRKVRSVLQRLSAASQENAFAAGATLRKLTSELVAGSSLLSGADKEDSPLDLWLRLLKRGSFGVSSGLAPRGPEGQVVHEGRSTLGFVRDGLARELFKRMEQWSGCRLAPLPSKCLPFHLPKEHFSIAPSFRAFLLGESPSLSWYRPPEDVGKMSCKVSLASVFGVADANSIIYAGGDTFSFLMKDHEKRTATAVLKQQGQVQISDLFGMPQDRDDRRAEAGAAVEHRVAEGKAPAQNLKGKAHRVPAGRTVGLVAEHRIRNVDLPAQETTDVEYAVLKAKADAEVAVTAEMQREEKADKKEAAEAAKKAAKLAGSNRQEAEMAAKSAAAAKVSIDEGAARARVEEAKVEAEKEVRDETKREAEARAAGAAAEAKKRTTKFHVKLQSNKASPKAHAIAFLTWLQTFPLVVLDFGDRWLASGVVAVLLSFDVTTQVDEEDTEVETTLVKMEFAFRVVRVSGYKWNHFHFKPPESEEVPASPAQEAKAAHQIESLLKRFTDPDFLKANPVEQAEKVAEVLGGKDAQGRIKMTMEDVMQREQILRDEARKKHQRYQSLDFVRRIDEICRQSGAGGDPIVVVGTGGGGTGRRGRQLAKHEVLLKILAGFFTVFMLDEYCTSKNTTCCHRECNAPRSKGRSRGCKNKECAERLGKPPWWDRDTGAAW